MLVALKKRCGQIILHVLCWHVTNQVSNLILAFNQIYSNPMSSKNVIYLQGLGELKVQNLG